MCRPLYHYTPNKWLQEINTIYNNFLSCRPIACFILFLFYRFFKYDRIFSVNTDEFVLPPILFENFVIDFTELIHTFFYCSFEKKTIRLKKLIKRSFCFMLLRSFRASLWDSFLSKWSLESLKKTYQSSCILILLTSFYNPSSNKNFPENIYLLNHPMIAYRIQRNS